MSIPLLIKISIRTIIILILYLIIKANITLKDVVIVFVSCIIVEFVYPYIEQWLKKSS